MSHFTEGVLQAYLDREVPADARAQVNAHVDECADCATRLQELHELNAALVSALDTLDLRTIPQLTVAQVRARARQRGWQDPNAPRRSGLVEFFAGRSLARAATVVLALSAAAVAAVPGSPVRDWLVSTWNSITEPEQQAVPAPAQPPAAAPVPFTPLGVGITPVSGRVRIQLQTLAEGTRVHVVLVDADKAMVEASGQAASARPRSGPGPVITITGGGMGDLRISLPRTVEFATVEVDGKLYVSKEGDSLRFLGPTADTIGTELVFKPGH